MPKTPKLIHAEGPFEVYRYGSVLIIQRDGEFYCNLRKSDNGFANPAKWVADAIRCEAEAVEDRARAKAARLADAEAYLALRAAREADKARQGVLL